MTRLAIVLSLVVAPMAMAGQSASNEKFPPAKMAEIRALLVASK